MKGVYSHAWLQTFFEKQLPSPDVVHEGLLKHSFEVEKVRKTDTGDTVYELEVLPDRSADCLAHYGIAKEISAIFSLSLTRRYFTERFVFADAASYIRTDKCNRYTILKIDDISLSETPEEIQRRLEAVGQRCINPLVDLSNYVLFDIGQPIHIFDARKVSGRFSVRRARANECLVLLGGEEMTLCADDVVIVDAADDRVIALAGVKGGEETRVDADTRQVYIEIASFNNVSVRRTMRRTGYISGAALRFSQGFPPELIDYTAHRVAEIFGAHGSIAGSFDCTRVHLPRWRKIAVSVSEINAALGTTYTQRAVAEVFDRFGLSYDHPDTQERFVVAIPVERPDLRDENDLVEEVGRLLGYDTVPSVAPLCGFSDRLRLLRSLVRDQFLSKENGILKKRTAVLRALQGIGFSEVITSSFYDKGEVCVVYPVAKDKGCLRTALYEGIQESLTLNAYNGELLGLGEVRIAEIGSVFTKDGEQVWLALGVRETLGRPKVDYAAVEAQVRKVLVISGGFEDGVWEAPLAEVSVRLVGAVEAALRYDTVQYVSPSKYPFVLRDVAMFVPFDTDAAQTEALLRKNGGEYLRQVNLFDSFKKDGKISYAFRLVFQSDDETLDDTTVNRQMETLYEVLRGAGYEIR